MEDVIILNQFEVVTKTVFSWPAFWTAVLIVVGVALFEGITFGLQEDSFLAFIGMFLAVSIIGSVIIGLLSGYKLCPEPVEYETHYEVFINEKVSMKDFMDKYEIIETRGSIYTVREKSE